MTAVPSDDLALYAELDAARRALAADLLVDPATMARGLDPLFRMRPHLRVIGEAMRGLLAGDYDRLLVLTPPQVGKSTLVGEWGVFWWLANRPSDDVVIASYGADLAEARSKAVRARVDVYGDEYGLRKLRGSDAARDWRLESGAHLRAIGVGGGLSGFPANLLVIDDPHADRAEAESLRIRGAVHDWWSSTAAARLQPDVGAVVAIQTRWHLDDFAGRRLAEDGRLEEGGRWKVIHLPAIADAKFGPDPMGRAPGDPLTHPKIRSADRARLLAWWNDRKLTMGVREFHALCQGDPQPAAGALVKSELLRDIRRPKAEAEPQRIGVAVDPSGGGRDTAGIIGGFLGDDGRLWITDDWSGPMSSEQWSLQACRLAYDTGASVIFVETNFGADMATLVVRSAWAELVRTGEIDGAELCPLIRAVRARQGKLLRAEPIAQQMHMDRIRLVGHLLDLEHEWTTWQPSDPSSPGRIDASVYLGYGLLPIPSTGVQFATPSGTMPASSMSPLGGQGAAGTGLSPLA